MNDGHAISLGEYIGRKLKIASETNGQKSERALYHASAALVGVRDLMRKNSEMERDLILKDINLGVKAEIASYISQSKVKSLYESILRKLGL